MKIDAIHYRHPSSKAQGAAERLKGNWLAVVSFKQEYTSINLHQHVTVMEITFVVGLKKHILLTLMGPHDKRTEDNEEEYARSIPASLVPIINSISLR